MYLMNVKKEYQYLLIANGSIINDLLGGFVEIREL